MKPVSVLLDVDADFIVGNPDGELGDRINISGKEFGKSLRWFRKRNTRIHLIVDHHESLHHWDQEGVENALCIHVDAHHDLWRVRNKKKRGTARKGLRTKAIDCGNYLQQAMIDGIIRKVMFVPPQYSYLCSERDDIRRSLKKKISLSKVCVISWQAFQRMKTTLPKADIITIAISPEWTPKNLWPHVRDLCKELSVDPRVINAKKIEASIKWRAGIDTEANGSKFDFKFPRHCQVVSL